MRTLRHLMGMSHGYLNGEAFQACLTRRRPSCLPGRAGGFGWGEECLGLAAEATGLMTQI